MTAPADDGGDRPLSAAEQATVDEARRQLGTLPDAPEPPAPTAQDLARARRAQLMAGYRNLREVFDYYREAGFTTDQALRLIAYGIAAAR